MRRKEGRENSVISVEECSCLGGPGCLEVARQWALFIWCFVNPYVWYYIRYFVKCMLYCMC